MHKSTFLSNHVFTDDDPRNNKYDLLEDVMRLALQINIELLVFGRFASNYTAQETSDCYLMNLYLMLLNTKPVYLPSPANKPVL